MKGIFLSVFALFFVLTIEAQPYTRARQQAASNPNGGPCSIDRYRCDDGRKCIPLKWICDDVTDCDDKRDERNCVLTNHNATIAGLSQGDITEAQASLLGDTTSNPGATNCAPSKFTCDRDSKCLAMSSLCDTVRDCQDGSDEGNCPVMPKVSACQSDKFSCDDGAKCLPLTWLCDSINDCMDKQDEHNCPATIPGSTIARAAQDAAVTAAQEAKRAAVKAQQLMRTAQQAAEKARKAMEIAQANE